MAMIVTTVSLPDAEVGVPYSVQLTETGGVTPITWTQTAGTLPTGLSLSTAGVISGTPTVAAAATPLTFKATDSTPVTPQTASSSGLTLTVDSAVAISTSSLPSATVRVAYSTTLAATGGATPYTWSITAGSLPAGLSLAASTGIISGTPTAVVSGSITFKVTDNDGGTASKALSLTLNGSVQPVGSATVNPTASQTFPLMPQCWPLTVIPGSDPVSAQVPPLQVPQQPDATNTEQNDVIDTALTQAGETGARLL